MQLPGGEGRPVYYAHARARYAAAASIDSMKIP